MLGKGKKVINVIETISLSSYSFSLLNIRMDPLINILNIIKYFFLRADQGSYSSKYNDVVTYPKKKYMYIMMLCHLVQASCTLIENAFFS